METTAQDDAAATPSPTPPRTGRRPRVARACVACQQKKQKCDGGSPACRHCIKAKRNCISQDPSTNRQYPRGYVNSLEMHNASLEGHIALLENELQKHRPAMDLEHGRPESSSSRLDDQRADGLSNLDMLCFRAAGGDPHYFGSSSDFSFTKVFSASLRGVQAQGPGLTMGGISNPHPLSGDQVPRPKPLPERSRLVRLTKAYFDQVHPQFPFLHRPTYLEWEEHVLRARETGERFDPVSLFFVYAVASVGALTLSTGGDYLSQGLYASAETLFEHVVRLNAIESIQAILCCAMYSMRSPIGVSVWTLSGLALRQCIELGFHRKMPWSRIEPNALKSQMRRRVFWCSYNIDRAVSITLGRPVGIHDADIDVDFPLDLNDEAMTLTGPLSEPRSSNQQPATTISAAIHTIRVRQIWGRIQNVMYPQVVTSDMGPDVRAMLLRGFRAELRGWLEGAPEQLQSNREANNAFGSHEWFEIMYHHSILMLYRQSLTAAQEGEAFLECARAGERICQLYRHLHMRNQLKDTWGALHVLFLGSVTFLYCLWSSPETRSRYRLDEVAAICSCTMVILAVMAERYEVVRPYRDTFETLAGATQTMLVEAQTSSEPQVLPVLPTSSEHLSSDLADMAEFGMCSSIEVLLSAMIQ